MHNRDAKTLSLILSRISLRTHAVSPPDGGTLRQDHRKLAISLAAVAAVVIVLFGVTRWGWAEAAVQTAEAAHRDYGVDVPLALALFGVGEVVFIGSVAMMLREAGSRVTWRRIHAFKIRSLNLGSPRMTVWLWINRASWVVPWVIVILLSLGRVPWWATAAALAEVGATLGLGIVLTLGLKLPWWNDAVEEETA